MIENLIMQKYTESAISEIKSQLDWANSNPYSKLERKVVKSNVRRDQGDDVMIQADSIDSPD